MGWKAGRSGLPSPAIEAPTHVPFIILISFLERPGLLTPGLHPTLCFSGWGWGADEEGPPPHSPRKHIDLLNHFAV